MVLPPGPGVSRAACPRPPMAAMAALVLARVSSSAHSHLPISSSRAGRADTTRRRRAPAATARPLLPLEGVLRHEDVHLGGGHQGGEAPGVRRVPDDEPDMHGHDEAAPDEL